MNLPFGKKYFQIPAATILSALFFLSISAPVKAADAKEFAPVPVLVSLAPYAYLVQTIGGDRVKVQVLLPPGADEHLFEPSPSDLMAARRSRVWFMVGTAVEVEISWASKILPESAGMRAVDTSASMSSEQRSDPHVWVSPRNALNIALIIATTLKAMDPEGADGYDERYQKLRLELENLTADLDQRLAGLRGKTVLVNHPSWGHLFAERGILQEAVFEEGREPGPRRVFELRRLAREKGARAMILSPEHAGGPARRLAGQSGLKVVERSALDPDFAGNLLGLASELSAAYSDKSEAAQ